jgi:hypothetical protein
VELTSQKVSESVFASAKLTFQQLKYLRTVPIEKREMSRKTVFSYFCLLCKCTDPNPTYVGIKSFSNMQTTFIAAFDSNLKMMSEALPVLQLNPSASSILY